MLPETIHSVNITGRERNSAQEPLPAMQDQHNNHHRKFRIRVGIAFVSDLPQEGHFQQDTWATLRGSGLIVITPL